MVKKNIIFSILFFPIFLFSQNDNLMQSFASAAKKINNENNPYLNVQNYYNVIILGEKLLKNDPSTPNFQSIRDNMLKALEYVADVHKIRKYGISQRIHFYANISSVFSADDSVLTRFIKKYPNSKFTPVFRNIERNISFIDIPDNKTIPDTIYFVIVKEFGTLNSLNAKKFELLNRGYDIPHSFIKQKGNFRTYLLVYRFYTEPTKANKALNRIKKDFSEAYILKAKIDKKAKTKNIIFPY